MTALTALTLRRRSGIAPPHPAIPQRIPNVSLTLVSRALRPPQALKKHPGDRPTVMEMLHHPWIKTYQRRTSMRIPQVSRRRSSVIYNPGVCVGVGAVCTRARALSVRVHQVSRRLIYTVLRSSYRCFNFI